jgi:hypothetical protein
VARGLVISRTQVNARIERRHARRYWRSMVRLIMRFAACRIAFGFLCRGARGRERRSLKDVFDATNSMRSSPPTRSSHRDFILAVKLAFRSECAQLRA